MNIITRINARQASTSSPVGDPLSHSEYYRPLWYTSRQLFPSRGVQNQFTLLLTYLMKKGGGSLIYITIFLRQCVSGCWRRQHTQCNCGLGKASQTSPSGK